MSDDEERDNEPTQERKLQRHSTTWAVWFNDNTDKLKNAGYTVLGGAAMCTLAYFAYKRYYRE